MTNKTSEAAGHLLRIHEMRTRVIFDYEAKEEIRAVAEKFRRMENVFIALSVNPAIRCWLKELVDEILAFDPLNSSSPNSLISSAQ